MFLRESGSFQAERTPLVGEAARIFTAKASPNWRERGKIRRNDDLARLIGDK